MSNIGMRSRWRFEKFGLRATAQRLDAQTDWDPRLGYGIINAAKALDRLS